MKSDFDALAAMPNSRAHGYRTAVLAQRALAPLSCEKARDSTAADKVNWPFFAIAVGGVAGAIVLFIALAWMLWESMQHQLAQLHSTEPSTGVGLLALAGKAVLFGLFEFVAHLL